MTEFSGYEDGYEVGYETGRASGYSEGVDRLIDSYEERISALWIELKTLGARVDYLEKHTGLREI